MRLVTYQTNGQHVGHFLEKKKKIIPVAEAERMLLKTSLILIPCRVYRWRRTGILFASGVAAR